MKRTMIAFALMTVVTSFNAAAINQSQSFDDAVSDLHRLQALEKEGIAHYNDTTSRDGTGRFNPDGSMNYALTSFDDQITADRRAAEQKVNGSTYRDQIQQQQKDAVTAAAYNRNATADKLGQQMQQEKMVDHGRVARDAAIANFDAQERVRDQQAKKMSGMSRQPMVSLTPSHTIHQTASAHPDTTQAAADAQAKAVAQKQQQAMIDNYGVKTNPAGHPVNMMSASISALPVTVGVKTPVQTVPSVIMKKPVVTSKIAFATAKGNGGSKGGHASNGGSGNRGGDNAHSSAFGGHGYGHDNSGSEGFGGHSHFH